MPFEKGNKLAPGRKKGSTNLSTEQLRQMICQALDKAGGVTYLVGVAKENPPAFCSLIGKVLPKQITGEGGGPININVKNLTDAELMEIASRALKK
jgi:hypothetical protein